MQPAVRISSRDKPDDKKRRVKTRRFLSVFMLVESGGLRLAPLACISSACQKICSSFVFLEPLLSNLRFSSDFHIQEKIHGLLAVDLFLVESGGLRLAPLACISSACQKICSSFVFLEPLLSNLRFSSDFHMQEKIHGLLAVDLFLVESGGLEPSTFRV